MISFVSLVDGNDRFVLPSLLQKSIANFSGSKQRGLLSRLTCTLSSFIHHFAVIGHVS
jgi:hypothetical protein